MNYADHQLQLTSNTLLRKKYPYRYECGVRLNYSVFDVAQNRFAVPEHEVSASAKANYTTQILEGGLAAGLLGKFGGKAGKVGAVLLVGGGLYELRRQMQKAVNRCPGLASRNVFNTMVRDINRSADFAVRVTGINYGTGTLEINAGRSQGLSPGDQFQLSVNGNALPFDENGLSADYYTATVTSLEEATSVCEVRHIRRRVGKASEKFQETPDLGMAQRLPDPATGIVAARAWVEFPPIPIISDQDVQRSLELASERENQQQQQAQANQQPQEEQNQQSNASTGAQNDDPLGHLLDKVFRKKKK